MGKSERVKQQRELKEEKRSKALAEHKKARKRNIILWSSVFCALAVLISAWLFTDDVIDAIENSGFPLRSKTALSSEHYKINGIGFDIMFWDKYIELAAAQGGDLESIGLDTSKDLSEQTIEGSEMTWRDYFVNGATAEAQQNLLFAEGAREEGFSLPDGFIPLIEKRAEEAAKNYGSRIVGITTKDVYQIEWFNALNTAYRDKLLGDVINDQAALDAYRTENEKTLQTVDYYTFPFVYNENGKYKTKDEALAAAQPFVDAKSEDEFVALIKSELPENAIAEQAVDAYINFYHAVDAIYTSGDAASEWLFDGANAANSTYLIEDDEETTVTVYFKATEAATEDYATKNIRHIMFPTSFYASADEAEAKAQEILDLFNAGGKTTNEFALLAAEYSADTTTMYRGGHYRNMLKGQIDTAFDDWAYDEARKPGDCEIIESSFGFHIIYLDGDGLPAWAATSASKLFDTKQAELSTSYAEKFKVEARQSVIDLIENS
jgi:hypothetical protein